MTIGIIGAGHIGATAARLFVQAGHEVAISNSRGPESLQDLVSRLGSRARAVNPDEAARSGEIVLLAVPWRSPEALPSAQSVKGKIVIDAMNPYSESGEVIDLGKSTSSEETAKRLPGCRLVKAFNTIYWEHLGTQGDSEKPLPERRAIFIAGDDPAAKKTVAKLIEQIGFAPIDTGSLREGGLQQEPGAVVYNRDLTAQQVQSVFDYEV